MVYKQYGGSGKFSPQQLHIMDQKRKENERIRNESRKKKEEDIVKPNWTTKEIIGFNLPKVADYEAVSFYKGEELILELRVSGTAIVNQPCGLKDKDVHEWLWNTGLKFIAEVKEKQILMITSYDVIDGELKTVWNNLRREKTLK